MSLKSHLLGATCACFIASGFLTSAQAATWGAEVGIDMITPCPSFCGGFGGSFDNSFDGGEFSNSALPRSATLVALAKGAPAFPAPPYCRYWVLKDSPARTRAQLPMQSACSATLTRVRPRRSPWISCWTANVGARPIPPMPG